MSFGHWKVRTGPERAPFHLPALIETSATENQIHSHFTQKRGNFFAAGDSGEVFYASLEASLLPKRVRST